MKELKVRCGGFAGIEQKIRNLDGSKVGEFKETAIYFDTEGRGALKIVQGEKGARMVLVAYNEENGCFDIALTPVGEAMGARRIFNKLFSSLGQVVMEKKVYVLGREEIWLVHINQLGNFMLIRGEDAERIHELGERLECEFDKIVKEDFGEMLSGAGKKI
ncbi:hypothetical protein GF415_02455 [Candidatus Micrarchaeota archaeon]|nr:hypothetical protein [Candidatus Micrarchaeota archaeon]